MHTRTKCLCAELAGILFCKLEQLKAQTTSIMICHSYYSCYLIPVVLIYKKTQVTINKTRKIKPKFFQCWFYVFFSFYFCSPQDNYTFAQPGIQRKVKALEELVSRIDGESSALLAFIHPTHPSANSLFSPQFFHFDKTSSHLSSIFLCFFLFFFYKSDLCTKQSTNPWGSHAKAVNKISTLWSEIIVFQYKGNIIFPPNKLPFMSISLAHVFALILYSVLKTVQKYKIQFLFVHVLCKTC